MPTIFTHVAPVLGMSGAFGEKGISSRLLWVALFFSILPDLDGIGFLMGIPYDSAIGHRGMSHSLAMVFIAFLIGWIIAPWLQSRRWVAALVLSLAVLSHILLDAMTNGGLGVAFFWPIDETRYFLPWRPIRVSPISPRAFFAERGLVVLLSELKWVWIPCLIGAVGVRLLRKIIGCFKK